MNGSNGWIMKDKSSSLPTDAKKRKEIPVTTGFLDYFPDAIAAVAELSRIGNEQHNPGKPLHWDRSKSGDESDALGRHFLQRGSLDTDGVRHSCKVAWRAMALLQKEIESAQYAIPIPSSQDGWIEWNGFGIPPIGTVEIMFESDDVHDARYVYAASDLRWIHIGSDFDIVRYRQYSPIK